MSRPPPPDPGSLGGTAATGADRRRAAAVAVGLAGAFAATVRWADRPLPAAPAFVVGYDAAVVVLDLVTALLLFAESRRPGGRPLVALGCGYLFTPPLVAAHALSVPGAFTPDGPFGPQATAWLWMGWYGLFPLFVIGYAALARRDDSPPADGRTAALAAAGTLTLAAVAVLLAVAGGPALPELMLGDAYRSPATQLTLAAGWAAHLVALGLLIRATRLRRRIDLWVAVALTALVIDLALSGVLVTGRYQLGWYLGRAYGLVGAGAVLGVLLRSAAGLSADAARAAARLAGSEALHRAISANLPNAAVFVVGPDLRYRLAEGEALRAAGYAPADLEGKTLREALPAVLADRYEPYYRAALAGEPFRLDHADHGRVYLSHGVPLRAADGRVEAALVVSYDVTERAAAEAALRASEDRQAFALRLADALRPLADPAAIEAEACRLLGEHLRADRAYYVAVDEAAGVAVVGRDYLRGDSPSLAGRHRVADFGWVIPPMRRGETLVIPDVATSALVPAADRPAMAAVRIAAHVNAPLVKDGTLVGAVCVTEPAPRAWTADEVRLVEESAERIWAAVERARAEAAVRASEGRNAFLVRLSDAVRGLSDPDRVAEEACRLLTARLGTERTLWADIDRAAGEYVADCVVLADGRRGGPSRWPLDPTQPFAAEHLAGRPVAYDDAEADPRIPDPARAAMAARGLRAGVAVPVVVGGDLRAVLSTSQPTPRRWRPEEVAFAEAFAGRAWAEVERARAEAALRASEEKYRALFESMDEAYAVVEVMRDPATGRWADFLFLEVNPAFVRHTGMPDPVGRTATDLLGTPNPRWAEVYGRVAETGEPVRLEEREPLLDRVFDLFIFRLGGPGDRRVAVLFADVTGRTRAEAALRAEEERLRLALAVGGLATWDWDLRTGRVAWSDEHYTMQGYRPGEVVPSYQAWAARVHPDDRPAAEAAVAAARDGRRPYACEFRSRHPDGTVRWLSARGSFFYDAAGRPVRMIGVMRDVTDERRQAAALRASEERLRLALTAARMGTWTWDVAADRQTRDPHLNRLLGLDPVETVGPMDEFFARVHPDDRGGVRVAFQLSAASGNGLAVEFRAVWPGGNVRWLRAQGDVVAVGGREHLAGAAVDVSDRREAQESLRASEERLRRVVESATDYAIMTIDPLRRISSWSPGAAALFGYTSAEAIGTPSDLLFTPEDRAAGAPEEEAWQALRYGRAANERWHLRKDGGRFYASGVLTPLGPGGAFGFVKVLRDLTDRKRMEDELRDARDRLEELVAERTAALAAALASLEAEAARRADLARRLATAQEDERRRVARDLHDQTGQLLAGLALAVRAAETAGPLPPAAGERLAEVRRIADDLGRQVHALAVRLRPTALDDVGLEAALGQLVREWAARAGVPIDFETAGLADRLPAEAETVLYRVVQEALTNVAKHARATRVSVVVSRHAGTATAAVEDDGVGFDPEAAGAGRLGLVGMRERVTLAGGELDVESAPGAGTTIIARLPIG
jgi:PAS domain S-box-containing protein